MKKRGKKKGRRRKSRSLFEVRPLLDTVETANLLRCHRNSVYRWVRGIGVRKPLPCIQVTHGKLLFDYGAVLEWLGEIAEVRR